MEIIAKVRQIINPPYLKGDYIKLFGTLVILLAIPLTVFVTLQARGLRSKAAQLLGASAIKSVVEPGSMVTEANYIIFIDGSNYYARNGKTGEIQFSDSDAGVVIQAAIDALPTSGGNVQLTEGTFQASAAGGNAIELIKNNVTLAGVGIDATKINVTGVSEWTKNIYVGGNYDTLRDFTISGTGGLTYTEINIQVEGNDASLIRVRSTNSGKGKANNSANLGFYKGQRAQVIDFVSDNGGSTMADDNNNQDAVHIYNFDDVYIRNLVSRNNNWNGLGIWLNQNQRASIINYHSDRDKGSGLKIYTVVPGQTRVGDYLIIENPHIFYVGAMGIDGSALGSPIYAPIKLNGGIVEGSAGNGVDFNKGWGWEAIGTTSRLSGMVNISETGFDPEGYGFAGGPQDKARLINVRAESNWSAGIGIYGADGATIDGCVASNNGLGAQTKGVMIFESDSPPYSRNNIVRNCVFDDTQATTPKTLIAVAGAGQKTVKINPADASNFFSGQTVEIKEGANSETNFVDSVASANGTLTMFRNLKRTYNANTATVQGKATQYSGIDELMSSDYNLFENNSFKNITVPISIVGPHSRAHNNIGYATESSGTATISPGSTYVDVVHGLAKVPTRVILTPITNTAGKGYWVSDKNVDGKRTKFRISLSGSHTANIQFDWQALVE